MKRVVDYTIVLAEGEDLIENLTGEVKEKREAAQSARDFRLNFLRNLKPDHPMYHSLEARAARGEAVVE